MDHLLVTGKQIEDDYVLGEPLGSGGNGCVRVCWSRKNNKLLAACKTMPRSMMEFALREAHIMYKVCGHPGVITPYAVYLDPHCVHIVMELCPSGDLLRHLYQDGGVPHLPRPHSEVRAAFVTMQLMSVLKFCHERGVVHRDIKPENILLNQSGCVMVADFGLSVDASERGVSTFYGTAGTLSYMAPEVLAGTYTDKVDIWSAGVVLHLLLVGSLPFNGLTSEEYFEHVNSVTLANLFEGQAWKYVSPGAKDLVSKMMSLHPSSRPTAEEVLHHPWITSQTGWLDVYKDKNQRQTNYKHDQVAAALRVL